LIIRVYMRFNIVGFGYRTTGIATTPIVQAPTLVVCRVSKKFW